MSAGRTKPIELMRRKEKKGSYKRMTT